MCADFSPAARMALICSAWTATVGLRPLYFDSAFALAMPSRLHCHGTRASGRLPGGGRDWRDEDTPRPPLPPSVPPEIISHAVRLYHVFSLSLRDVELKWLSAVSSSPTRR